MKSNSRGVLLLTAILALSVLLNGCVFVFETEPVSQQEKLP